jgi:hypothetical protein
MMSGGAAFVLSHLPAEQNKNVYYWFRATQFMRNMGGPAWKTWNRRMRSLLVSTQNTATDECAIGSRDPKNDAWGDKHAGRLYETRSATLTLEVYYRYLPVYGE